MRLENLKINFIGDSITEGYCATVPQKCFVSLIAQKTGALCRNYGIAGTRIARQDQPSAFESWNRDFGSRVDEMDADADVIVIFGGTNDYGHGAASLGVFADRTPYTFYGALHLLYTDILTKYPHAHVVVLTPLHRLDEDVRKGDPNKYGVEASLKAYVDIIREVAEYYSLPVLDLFAHSGIQPKVPAIGQKYMMDDGVHPNDAGHELLSEKIIAYLKREV